MSDIASEVDVSIPTDTPFVGLSSSSGIVWSVNLSLVARFHYSAMMEEPRQEFITKMTLNSITASRELTYTDPDTNQTVSAGKEFTPYDKIIDELGARKEFENIKFLKAYFRVDMGAMSSLLTHFFWDQEVHAPSGHWGTNSPSLLSWNAFITPFVGSQGARVNDERFIADLLEGNESLIYSKSEIDALKAMYKDVAETEVYMQRLINRVSLLRLPAPEIAGLYDFEQAIMRGLREKIQRKPKISLERLENRNTPTPQPASERQTARNNAINDVLAKRFAAVRDSSRNAIDSTMSSGRANNLDQLPAFRGQWQALDRYIAKERVLLLPATSSLYRESDEIVNLKDPNIIRRIEDAISLATANETAATLGTVNFTCPNHRATISAAGGGKIRFNGDADGIAEIHLRDMTDVQSVSGGGSGTLRIYTRNGQAWWLGDCGNIDSEAAAKLDLCRVTLKRGIDQLAELKRQIEQAAKGVVTMDDAVLAREIAALEKQADNAVQAADIRMLRSGGAANNAPAGSTGQRMPLPSLSGPSGGGTPSISSLRRKIGDPASSVEPLESGKQTQPDNTAIKPVISGKRLKNIFNR
ncbi:MAG: hypothetical protein LIP23_09955 [Planctomycetes bacterium]|nr:hypothetical protein [Planctomycetota bacterium]